MTISKKESILNAFNDLTIKLDSKYRLNKEKYKAFNIIIDELHKEFNVYLTTDEIEAKLIDLLYLVIDDYMIKYNLNVSTKFTMLMRMQNEEMINFILDFAMLELRKDIKIRASKSATVEYSNLSNDDSYILKKLNNKFKEQYFRMNYSEFKHFIDTLSEKEKQQLNLKLHSYTKKKLRIKLLNYMLRNKHLEEEDYDYITLILFYKLKCSDIDYDKKVYLLRKNNYFDDYKYYFSNKSNVKLIVDKEFKRLCDTYLDKSFREDDNSVSDVDKKELNNIFQLIT